LYFTKSSLISSFINIEGTKYQIRVDSTLSEALTVKTGLKQGDTISPLLFNLALEKAGKMMEVEESGIAINDRRVHVLGFADDLNIVSESLESVLGITTAAERATAKVGLQINMEKAKIMELIDEERYQDDLGAFEKVEKFQYLGVLLSTKNDWLHEIGVRIAKAESASFALSKFFKSKALQENKIKNTQ